MITYVNNSNATRYSVLFEQATQDLIAAQIKAEASNDDLGIGYQKNEDGTPSVDEAGLYIATDPIKTIEKYFYYLPKLSELGDANSLDSYKVLHSIGRRYTMLPLSEDPFEIDGNKRSITVPSAFSTNGVAAQGDQLAEVLYFRVDRYFDAKDLDDADIYIQWTNANGETGLSAPIVIDIESEPNKIIFGWALSSAITEKAGNIQFAVRFYKWANDAKTKLSYSWATQTATVKVTSTLDFTLSEAYLQQIAANMKEENDLLMSRIKSGVTYVTDNEEAVAPVYVLNIKDDENGSYQDGVVYIDLDHNAVDNTDTYVLKVEAKSEDSGVISYSWTYESLDKTEYASGATIGSDADPSKSTPKVTFELTTDTEVKDKVYYKKDGNAYKAFDPKGLAEDETPAKAGLYEKVATLTISKVGKFFATATNSKAGTNAATKESDICIVPMPVQPTITKQVASSATIKKEENAKVSLSVSVDNSETNGTKNGTLTYKWFMKNESAEEYKEISGATDNSLILGYSETLQPKDIEGYYMVTAYNTKNGQTVEIESAACHVSYVAEAPIIAFPANADDVKIDFSSASSKKNVKITLNQSWYKQWNISDEIQYQWYTTTDEVTDNDNDTPIEGATSASYMPTETGKYFCRVTNVKNGTEATKDSLVFFVV